MRMRWLAIVCGMALMAGAGWGVGFAAFENTARKSPRAPPPADGIVALTGGADRIETALHLLEGGSAPLMLISGVGRGMDMQDLGRRVTLSRELAAHVTLGRVATTTQGNAAETAAWARAHRVRSLIVVTAGYHMPRALIEIGRALPDVTLYPVPVRPPALRGGMELATLRMLANEYDKYLAVRFGLTRKTEADGS